MVIDLKQIEVKKNIHDNALWLVEQIPTKVEAADVTPILRAGDEMNTSVVSHRSVFPSGNNQHPLLFRILALVQRAVLRVDLQQEWIP